MTTAGLKVEVDMAGVGGLAREGGMVGVRVRITDTSVTRRNVAVRLVMRDADGDYFAPGRVVPLTPGVAQPVWVYAWLPLGAAGNSMWLGVYPIAGDGGLDAAILDQPLAKIELGDSRSSTGRSLSILEPDVPLLLRVGPHAAGLNRFASASTSAASMLFLHEPMQIVEARTVAELPDSWIGLAPISTMVWTSGEPGELRGAYAQAVREWILHGGHLVVVLPSAGQTWLGPVGHELADLMPEVDVTRRDGVDLTPYGPLLTRSSTRFGADALKGIVHEFKLRDGVSAAKAVPILSGPGGDCIAVRRSVGSGAITVIGLDLTRQSSIQIDADVFWHRILGTRGQLLTAQESAGATQQFSRSTVVIDEKFPEEMAKGEQSQRAVTGVLLGLIVFVLYWALAGPVSYAVLRKLGLARHSWLAFTGFAGLFTLIAWGGAWLIKPGETKASHLTLFEHVHGQSYTRSRTWLSVMLPWYGEARVGVGGMDGRLEVGAKRELRNTIAPWTSGRQGAGAESAFPDTRDYSFDVTNPSTISFPARSTVKQLQVEWVGGTLWRTPYPVTDADELGGELKSENGRLTGRLKHDLPGELTSITVMYFPGQRPIASRPDLTEGWRGTVSGGWVMNRTQAWGPGATLDLSVLDGEAAKNRVDSSLSTYLDRLAESAGFAAGLMEEGSTFTMSRRMQLLTALGQLGPPRLGDKGAVSDERRFIARRQFGQVWDASRWFTQPCVIILGELKGATPTPLFVDGEALASEGTTWVRWIYPLPATPPTWGGSSGIAAPADGSPADAKDIEAPR
ncbi:MAG: hypothetical protein HEQ23_04490 [Tepidisphaera sp.]